MIKIFSKSYFFIFSFDIDNNSSQHWYKSVLSNHNGRKYYQLHRVGEPAIISEYESSYDQYWYQNDLLHRLEGPAIMIARTQLEQCYIEGKFITSLESITR